MDMTLIKDGLILLVIGMGFVMIFLTVMIVVMNVSTKIVVYLNKIFPEESEEVKTVRKKLPPKSDEAIAVAIAAAKTLK